MLLAPGCANDRSVRAGRDAAVSVEAGPHDASLEAGTCPAIEPDYGAEVSFTDDLLPFFAVACAFGGCHDADTRQAGLFLGWNVSQGPTSGAAAREVHDNLLSPATTTADLPRVTPGDPSRSFLMIKVEGCQAALGLTCVPALAPCGNRMPYLSPPLPSMQRAMLARWIKDGARFASSTLD